MTKTLVIAEIGVNHNGNSLLLYKLIDKACECGADIIKFQSFSANTLTTKLTKKTNYQKKVKDVNQYEMLKSLELDKADYIKIINYCNRKKIKVLFSPFSIEDISFLSSLGIKEFKIPSGEIVNIPYLRLLSKLANKLIISTGMSTIDEIDNSIEILTSNSISRDQLSLLHCTSEYPAPFDEINLNVLSLFQKKYNLKVGYSDHSIGISVPIAAVALGAKIIEKHFTIDKNLIGPDHSASADPIEFKNMVDSIRNIEKALGSFEKKPTTSELLNLPLIRKFIVAKKKIKKGDFFSDDNLCAKRHSNGISVYFWDNVIGKKALKDFNVDEEIYIDP